MGWDDRLVRELFSRGVEGGSALGLAGSLSDHFTLLLTLPEAAIEKAHECRHSQ